MTYGRPSFEANSKAGNEREERNDGSFEIALDPWMIDRMRKLYPQVEANVQATVRTIVGPGFSDRELGILTDRALKAAQYKDIPTLTGIEAGVPVEVDARQGRAIDRIVDGLGADELGRRARDAYGKARADGQVRIR